MAPVAGAEQVLVPADFCVQPGDGVLEDQGVGGGLLGPGTFLLVAARSSLRPPAVMVGVVKVLPGGAPGYGVCRPG